MTRVEQLQTCSIAFWLRRALTMLMRPASSTMKTSRDATKRYEFHMLRVYMMYWYTWNLQ